MGSCDQLMTSDGQSRGFQHIVFQTNPAWQHPILQAGTKSGHGVHTPAARDSTFSLLGYITYDTNTHPSTDTVVATL